MFQARFSTTFAALGLLVSSGLAACGDDAKNDPTKFVGTYVADTGEAKLNCAAAPGLIPPASLMGEKLTLTPKTGNTIATQIGTCMLELEVMGDIATARKGQTCTMTVTTPLGPVGFQLTVETGTLTLAGNKATFTQTGAATTVVALPGFGSGCTYQIDATATKMP